MRRTEARVLSPPAREEDRFLPEGPRSLKVDGEDFLVWVNIQTAANAETGSILGYRFQHTRSHFAIPVPGRPGFALPGDGERLLVGVNKSLLVCDLASGEWSDPLATIPDANPRTIINDAEIVPGGEAIVFGTKDTLFQDPIANLYLYTLGDNRVAPLAGNQTCSNGKIFATDDRGLVLYDIDTPTRKVARYRLDLRRRTATPDGVALDLAQEPGFPDGMCDCGDGTAIVAFYNPECVEAGRAVRFDLANGTGIEEWTTPGSPRVTCPVLVQRPDGVKLILTTATEGMLAEMRANCPNAGCLFIADTGFASCPDPELVIL